MPPSALARLAALHIEYPMLFELTAATDEPADELAVANVSAAGTSSPATAAKTHAGVLEFIAEEGRVYVPGSKVCVREINGAM